MGGAQQFVYRFNGEGEGTQEKVFDKNGDLSVPSVGGLMFLHERNWKVVKLDKEYWGSVPAFIVYLVSYR